MRYVLFFCIILTSCTIRVNSSKNCNCKKIQKAYSRMESQIIGEGYYYFAPEKPVTVYGNDSVTHPPINRNIYIIDTCTEINFDRPSKFLNYYVDEKKLNEIKKWIDNNCEEK